MWCLRGAEEEHTKSVKKERRERKKMKRKERQRAGSDLGAEEFRLLLQLGCEEADAGLNGRGTGRVEPAAARYPLLPTLQPNLHHLQKTALSIQTSR
jgi:hypothetical protein